MQSTALDLTPQTAEVARVVALVRDDQLGDPTPDEGTPVGALLDHLVGLTTAFTRGARKEPVDAAPRASADALAADWRTRLPRQLAELAAAWQRPDAWEGTTEVGGVRLPAELMGVIAANEVLVHGWDLAVAIGARYEADPAATRACLEYVTGLTAPGMEEMRSGQFGPIVPVPEQAPAFHRVLGLTGRNPSWRP